MFSFVKKSLGMVHVDSTPTYLTVEGLDTYLFFKDVYTLWGSTVIQKYMFTTVRRHQLKMRNFFALDFKYMLERIYDAPQSRCPRRIIRKILEELDNKTWLGQVKRADANEHVRITESRGLDKLVPFPLKPYQSEFVRHFGHVVPAYRLRGYMLDAAAGSGKTVTTLLTAAATSADKVIVISPKNAINRVWEDTVKDIMVEKRPYWVSSDTSRGPSLNDYYYIVHYEQLERILEFVKANAKQLKNVFVILDESHNFNRQVALRTQHFIELCRHPSISYNIWSSGTPIMALGSECIPFLKAVDPMFDPESEERFRKIYGRDAKRANDILRNRIGHLKFHVPSQASVKIEPIVSTLKIRIPGGEQFALAAISEKMRKFIEERQKYYLENGKRYQADYDRALAVFAKTLRTTEELKLLEQYVRTIDYIKQGFDPSTMKAEAQFCNNYELRTIIPALPQDMKAPFKSARSVVKYVNLKIMGEALGSVLGKERTRCHVEMVKHLNVEHIIDNSKKKVLFFTSFVEVVDTLRQRSAEAGYSPAVVYGATNKDLAGIVSRFYKDQDLNPLIATFQSLSTAVPLTAANTVVFVNQPFRSGVREQTIARAARLGQDEDVYVIDVLLDTGDLPNISTRSNDIMQWSQEQVASIMGVKNLDLDSLALESLIVEDEMATEQEHEPLVELPQYLYHGSMYKQTELMPGYQRSGKLVRWDNSESNTWLYTISDFDTALMMGVGSIAEKLFGTKSYRYDLKTHTLTFVEGDKPVDIAELKRAPLYLYIIKADSDDGWVENYNPANGMSGEYKTQQTIRENIVKCTTHHLSFMLEGWDIRIERGEYSSESVGLAITAGAIGGVYLWATIKEWMDSRKEAEHTKLTPAIPKMREVLKNSFGNESWLSRQTFHTDTIKATNIADRIYRPGKFDPDLVKTFEEGVANLGKLMKFVETRIEPVAKTMLQENAKLEAVAKGLDPSSVEDGEKFDEHVARWVGVMKKFPNPLKEIDHVAPWYLNGLVSKSTAASRFNSYGEHEFSEDKPKQFPLRIDPLDKNGVARAAKALAEALDLLERFGKLEASGSFVIYHDDPSPVPKFYDVTSNMNDFYDLGEHGPWNSIILQNVLDGALTACQGMTHYIERSIK